LRFQIRQYQKLTGESGPVLAKRLSELSSRDISDKTLWNWINNRYTFNVFVECSDKDIKKITGVFKQYRII